VRVGWSGVGGEVVLWGGVVEGDTGAEGGGEDVGLALGEGEWGACVGRY